MIAVGVVALIHVYILVLEMFLWTKPAGLRAFGLTPERAESSRVLAMNQGLYNGFLAAGLVWSMLAAHDGFMIAASLVRCAKARRVSACPDQRSSMPMKSRPRTVMTSFRNTRTPCSPTADAIPAPMRTSLHV